MNAWKPGNAVVPVKSWCPDAEPGAVEQINNAARLPFAFHHVALMPDAHQGFGAPIGGVLATEGVVVPNFVGVDIGCGMCACRTAFDDIPRDLLLAIVEEIRRVVPVGFSRHTTPAPLSIMPALDSVEGFESVVMREFEKARFQIGTLGGGNHFIEIQRGSDGMVWAMIHSGSRNLGKQVADHYNKVAQDLNARWHSAVPKEWDLAFLPLDTEEGRRYMAEMEFCVKFARANRERIMGFVLDAIDSITGNTDIHSQFIDIAHNFAALEHHFGKNVVVHRKGATRIDPAGGPGIIPGSQGSKSFIVHGLRNADSFSSCSHGAGRRMGRKEAQRTLSLEAEVARMENLGVIHGIKSVQDLDEAAGAYKDVDVVMANQADLVDILVELKPLAVVKG